MSDRNTNSMPEAMFAEEESMHLRHYLRVLFQHWKLSLLVFVAVFAGVAVYTWLQEPVYQASATLEVSKGGQQNAMLGRIGMESDQSLAAEIQMLESRSMAAEVARQLNLSPLDKAIDQVQRAVGARESGRGTNILQISALSTDPRKARDMVNAMAEIYSRQSVVRKTEEAGKTVDFIDNQLGGLRDVLDRSEQQLQEYKIDSGMITLGPEGSSLVTKVVAVDQQKLPLDMKIRRIGAAMESVTEAIEKGQAVTPPLIEGVPASEEAAGRLAELKAEKKELLVDFTPAHPAVVAVDQKILRVHETLLNSYRAALESLRAKRRDLDSAMAEYEREMEKIPEAELELARRTRDQQVNAQLYTHLLQKQQEARIAQAATISNVKIIDPAITPGQPVKPDKKKNLMLGGVLGLMLAAGLAFFLDYMDSTVKESDEASRLFGRPVLSVIPHFPAADGKDGGRRLVTLLEPKSPTAEAFRSLRTGLHFSNLEKDKKVILVTSSLPNEGKTTVATNLAITLAQTGDRVLLIGADLRRPSLNEVFDSLPETGLTEMLSGRKVDPTRPVEGLKLDVFGGGTVPPNPSELLGSNRMTALLEAAARSYDYVVIDGPPTLPVTDAQILSAKSDMVLVVLEPGRVAREAFQRLRATLESVDAPLVGLALNDKTGKGFKYYGSYSYYGHKQYGGYYG